MKHLALFAAMAASSIAIAQAQPTMVENEPQTMDAPDTMETQVYDGPDSNTPGQPAPDGSEPAVPAQRLDTYQPTQRTDTPVCNEENRDNCTQAIDPGGSDPTSAGHHGTMGHDNMDAEAPADGTDMDQPDPDGVGGPAPEDEWYVNTRTASGNAAVAVPPTISAQRLDAYRPFVRDSYPPCSATVLDNCVQSYDPR